MQDSANFYVRKSKQKMFGVKDVPLDGPDHFLNLFAHL